ncbi:uncharacterized protein [Musca autumnalis]|uniref:uncharacterized protein n=1 Tax=Musca autumnalis TaxID=221902 RepID=UPI003CF8039A
MIGTWNVRTLSEPSRLEQACREMDTYKLSVLGLNRIIVARLNSRFRKIAIIQCYAPTEPDDESVKDDFYSQLDATISSLPGGDIKILMGDFNAKVGNTNAGIEASTVEAYNTALSTELNNGGRRDGSWQTIVDACNRSAQTVLGRAVNRRKPWITDTTWAEIQKRKNQKNRIEAAQTNEERTVAKFEYRITANNVKKLARLDSEVYFNKIADEAEQASNVGNMRQVYVTIKKLSGNNIRSTASIRDKNGAELTTSDEQLNRWCEFFSENSTTSQNYQPLPTPSRRNQRRDIATHPPTRDEIKSALESLRNGKSSGPDNIPAELLKYGAPSLVDALFPIIRTAWTTSKIQDAWKEGVIITIPKKGDLKECKNWRGITLLNSIAKLMASLLLNRIRPAVESILRCEQAGFRTGRSCADHINTLRIIIEQSKEYNAHLYLLFVDFERAFDTISRDALWEILSLNGIPDKIILLIRELYRNSTCRVRFNTAESSPFMTTAGVKQGCILSPTLFLLMLDFVMNKTNSEAPCGIRWNLNNRLPF